LLNSFSYLRILVGVQIKSFLNKKGHFYWHFQLGFKLLKIRLIIFKFVIPGLTRNPESKNQHSWIPASAVMTNKAKEHLM